jgi:hypothetical protein
MSGTPIEKRLKAIEKLIDEYNIVNEIQITFEQNITSL